VVSLTKILQFTLQTVDDYLNVPEFTVVELLLKTMQNPDIVSYDGIVVLDYGLGDSLNWNKTNQREL